MTCPLLVLLPCRLAAGDLVCAWYCGRYPPCIWGFILEKITTAACSENWRVVLRESGGYIKIRQSVESSLVSCSDQRVFDSADRAKIPRGFCIRQFVNFYRYHISTTTTTTTTTTKRPNTSFFCSKINHYYEISVFKKNIYYD